MRSLGKFNASEKGLSLFEILIALVIISAVSLAALPQLIDAREEYRLSAVARELVGNLNNARILAVTRNADMRITVTGTTTYQLQQDVASVWTLQETYQMPVGFTIGTTGALVEFHSRGNATPVTTFAVTNPNGNVRQVAVEASGRSYVQ